MKALIACAVILALGGVAQAKLAPLEPKRVAVLPEEIDVFAGTAGAMFESDYFRAPQTPSATDRIFPCRLQLRMFDKTRLAQSCNN